MVVFFAVQKKRSADNSPVADPGHSLVRPKVFSQLSYADTVVQPLYGFNGLRQEDEHSAYDPIADMARSPLPVL